MAGVTSDEDPPPEVLQSQGRERQEVGLPPRQKGHMGGRVSASGDRSWQKELTLRVTSEAVQTEVVCAELRRGQDSDCPGPRRLCP